MNLSDCVDRKVLKQLKKYVKWKKRGHLLKVHEIFSSGKQKRLTVTGEPFMRINKDQWMSLWVSTFSPGITKLVFQSLVVRSLRRYHVQSITLHPCPPIDYLLHADPYSSCQYRCINLYFESFLGDPLGDENLEVEPVNQSGPVPTDGKKHH